MKRIPLAGARELSAAASRTRALRFALAALLLLTALALAHLGRSPDIRDRALVPEGDAGLVALDVSASISPDTYARIGATLRRLARSDESYGLVVFSDTAYLALPPRTPALALEPYARYFTRDSGGAFPPNPWERSFAGGTRISTGLQLAARVARDAELERPAILLVSDLDDDPADVPTLRRTLEEFRSRGIRLGVVAVAAAPEDERFFRRAAAPDTQVQRARLPGADEPRRARFPRELALVAVTLAALLALNELWCARLTWRSA